MNEILKETLRDNEKVLWEGRTKPFSALEGKYGRKFVVQMIIAVIIAGGLIAGHISTESEPKMGLIAVILAIVAVVAAAPFMERRRLMGTGYWITDQRVIMIGHDKQARSMEIANIDAFKVTGDEKTADCLVLGSCVFDDAKKNMRWRAGSPKMPEEAGSRKDCALGMILYRVEETEKAAALLKELGCAKAA